MGERRGTKALETWCKRVTQGYPGVKVENMTTSWRDGLAFCAMIHHFRPDLIDFASLDKSDVFGNNELAFRIAERHLGIPALLDAEDMAEYPVPDRLSILTYLSQFYQAFASNSSSPVKKSADSPDSSIVSLGNVQPSSKMEGAPPWRELCLVCGNPVYLAQRLRFEGKLYHRTCFRCARCATQLSPANCYETVDERFCCETCPDEDMGKEEEEDEDKSPIPLSQIIVDESPTSPSPPPAMPHTRSEALPEVEPSPSHTASIVAMRKMLFDAYDKDTDDAKLIRVENNQKELVNSSGVKKNDLSENDDSSSRKISLVSNSETPVYIELDNKATDSLLCEDSTSTDVKLLDENAADSSIICDKESGSFNAEEDNLCTESKISSEKQATDEKTTDEEIKPPPRQRHTLKRSVPKVPDDATTTPAPVVSVVVDPPPVTSPVKLNPFDDDEDEEEVEETSFKQKSHNPFDSDSEESTEVANVSKSSSPALSPLRKTLSKNPFDSDEEEDDETVKAPVPLPRKIIETTPEPSPFPRSRLRASLTSLSSTYSTLSTQSTPRKKKPAPPPPPSSSSSPFNTLKSSPRHKKTRRAPLPPSVTSSHLSLASSVDVDQVNRSPSATADSSKLPSGHSSPPRHYQLAGESIANEISDIVDQIANLVETKREKDRLSLSVAEKDKDISKQPGERDEEKDSEATAFQEVSLSNSPRDQSETVKLASPAEPVDDSLQLSEPEHKDTTVEACPPLYPRATERRIEPPSLPAHPPPIDRPKPTSPLEPKISVMSPKQSFLNEPNKIRPVSMDVSTTSSRSSASYEDFSSPLYEKKSKDSVNHQRKISDGSASSYSLNKSSYGQWKRKKAPAPPLPSTPTRRPVQPMPMQKIRQELNDIEIKQQGLERQGVTLENTIRSKFESGKSITPYVEDLVLQLFELVNEKNDLFRRQAELMALRRQYNLEEEQADLEYQIRCLMARPEANKTDYDKELEEKLIHRLVEVVDMRNSIVECLDHDRLREAEEDRSIGASLGYFSKTPENNEEKRSKTMKKFYKKKKEKQGMKPAKSSCDLDKDFDESEKDPKSKKTKWYGLNTLKHKH